VADETKGPHHDEDERRRRQEAADEAESNPRRGAWSSSRPEKAHHRLRFLGSAALNRRMRDRFR
jgi:hypothetical protein